MSQKILHIVSVSFQLRYFVGNQFLYFKDKGYEFHVVCSVSPDLKDLSKTYSFNSFPIVISRNVAPIQDLISIIKLYSFIKKNRFDIVISHSPKGGLVGMIASYLARSPKRIFFRHGLVFETSKGFKRNLLIWIDRITSFCAHKIINVSPSIEEQAVKFKLNKKSKNLVLGKGTCNGVDIHRFHPQEKERKGDKVVVGFVGRLSKDKGIIELVEAWEILNKKYNNIELLLVGPYDERDEVPIETRNLIESDNSIKYLGEVRDTSPYYGDMDIFILPSYREGFPTVTLEAAASHLPVITTRNTGCIDSIVENVTGIFTEIDANSIAESIEFYIGNKKIMKSHGVNGRNFVVNNFSEEYVYREIENKIFKS